MEILHAIGFGLILAALAGAFLRTSLRPLAYALGFWGCLALMVSAIGNGTPWYWTAAYAVGMVVYIAAGIDALSGRRQAKETEDINV